MPSSVSLAPIDDCASLATGWAREIDGTRETHAALWTTALANALGVLEKNQVEAKTERKSAPWKVAVAVHLKQTTQATNRWIAEALHTGNPVAVSQYVGEARKGTSAAAGYLRSLDERPKTDPFCLSLV